MTPDPREPYGRIVHGIRLAFNADLPHPRGVLPWEEREAGQQELDMRIGAAVAAAEQGRAEAAEAHMAEARRYAARAEERGDHWDRSVDLQAAQVHATLAQTAKAAELMPLMARMAACLEDGQADQGESEAGND